MKKLVSTFGLLALMLVVTSFTTSNEPSGGKKPVIADYTSGGKKPVIADYTSGGKKPVIADW